MELHQPFIDDYQYPGNLKFRRNSVSWVLDATLPEYRTAFMTAVTSAYDPGKYPSRKVCAIIRNMNERHLEPGVLRVFRWFAWLRLLPLVMIPILFLRTSRISGETVDISLPIIITVANVLVLLLYLHIPGLEKRLGRYFFPFGILIATWTLIFEQYIFINVNSGWQLYPFLFVLLTLLAWQYRFRNIVFYSISIAIFEAVLLFVFPPQLYFGGLIPAEYQNFLSLGLLFSRTIIFLVIGYVVTTLMKEQREQRRALAEANQKLVQHAETLEQLTISRERNRLSRELHDTLAHTLSAHVVQLEALLTVWDPIPEKARQMLDGMLATTRSGLDETRRALGALRATPLEELGLALAVHTLAEDTASRCGYDLELNITENLDDLSPDVEQCYYRVAQEALANISNHAAPKKVSLRLDHNSSGLKMEIADDGEGFDLDRVSDQNGSKFGIKGMRERAELIDARFAIKSRLGVGTTIELILENAK